MKRNISSISVWVCPAFTASPRYTPGFTLQSGLETKVASHLATTTVQELHCEAQSNLLLISKP
ncbi:hypothetical protein [Pedobacter sp.]|uniref:hypothetical protein n=1 Tax=Pedobacter sp. TaxID=1411316 RepID=UPI003BAB5F44